MARPSSPQLEYSVLALGDTNYVQFCEAGKLFDLRLEELGARRISPRVDCDVDYEAPATAWLSGLFGGIEGHAAPAIPSTIAATAEDPVPALIDSSFGKSNPFPATLKTESPPECSRLNERDPSFRDRTRRLGTGIRSR